MHATPAQRKFINSTYSAEPPEMTDWAKERYEATKPSNGPRTHSLQETDDPVLKYCLPPGTAANLSPAISRWKSSRRRKKPCSFMNTTTPYAACSPTGASTPKTSPPPIWANPSAIGTATLFVVDTIGFNDKTWLDRDGHVHSDQLHVIERFHRTDFDNMQIDITMEDPKALAKPWVTQLYFQLQPKWDVEEQVCTDNTAFLNFEK